MTGLQAIEQIAAVGDKMRAGAITGVEGVLLIRDAAIAGDEWAQQNLSGEAQWGVRTWMIACRLCTEHAFDMWPDDPQVGDGIMERLARLVASAADAAAVIREATGTQVH